MIVNLPAGRFRRLLIGGPFVLTAVLTATSPGYAADNTSALTLNSVVQKIIGQHPDLQLNAVDVSIAATERDRVGGKLDPTLAGRFGLRDEELPVLSDFQAAETNTANLSGTVDRPARNGSTLSASIDYSRTNQGFRSPFAAQLAKFNPAYRGSISVQYRYPLFRGKGRPDYSEGLAASDADTRALVVQRRLIARTLGLQGLNQYFQLLSDAISLRIAEVAVDRARRLLEYQKFREQFGLVEKADRMQAEALLATRRLELESAHARQTLDQAVLNRLMRRDPQQPLLTLIDRHRLHSGRPSYSHSVAIALRNRPEFDVLAARRDAANARLRIAHDAEQRKLDIVAELGTLSLDDDVGTTLTRSLSPEDRFAGVALELSDTFGRRAARAEIRKAELELLRIDAEQRRTGEQVRDDVASALTSLLSGDETLRLARERASAESRKFEAEMVRYREGRSDTATILQFENELHAAELQADLEELALLLADRQLAWAQGNFLEQLHVNLPAIESVSR